MHSTASDGTTRPEELASLAKQAGLGAIALTDHDNTEGLVSCARACAEAQIEFAPGIEVSADPHIPMDPNGPSSDAFVQRHGTLHILGLFVRHDDPALAEVSRRMAAARDERNPAIVTKLNQLGIPITYEQVQSLAENQGTRIIGRPHLAEVLIDQGHAKSIKDAFVRYLGRGGAAYVRRDRLSADGAIEAIHHAGGLAVLAHPVQLRLENLEQLKCMVRHLKQVGLDGIETRHSDHNADEVERYERLADRYELLTSGGSDYHGKRKAVGLGSQAVPMEVFEKLRDESSKRS